MVTCKRFLLALAAVAVAGCSGGHGGAEQLVRRQMFDPEAARFRRVIRGEGPRTWCGEVNGRNRYGGYVGFRRFIADLDKGQAQVAPPDPAEGAVLEQLEAIGFRAEFASQCPASLVKAAAGA
jgi:hypothetical protein